MKVWQDGINLSIHIYQTLDMCRDFSIKDQMCRAAVSVPSNMAEGFEHHSNKEFIRFLRIAKQASGELRNQIYIAIGTGLVSQEKGTELISKTRHLSAMIQNLIKIRETNFEGPSYSPFLPFPSSPLSSLFKIRGLHYLQSSHKSW
ncbi:four helix bundle protein [Dyadobacter sp. CY261]|uniref:four helix bundle protein n=1 Tax=Dyadobacter sp. CY261 TaxID=2907203 RepID=UPI001F339241|nr:four helix bundle protein [Dyadobacter sp. CY261]MCF0073366.1 four helix bundle protein [Dyadobacter sp. CY261]